MAVTPSTLRREPPATGLLGWMKEHQVVSFFALAYAGSWLTWLPLLLGREGLGLFDYAVPAPTLLIVLGLFAGPALAAFLMTAVVSGRAGVRRLLRSYGQWRVGGRWYLVALVGPPLALLSAVSLFHGPALLRSLTEGGVMILPLILVTLAVLLVIGGPLAENPGWRGFALPRLQARFGPLSGSLILGGLWSLWHWPLFLIPIANTWEGSLLLYFAIGAALAIVFTWVYNNTRGSLLLVTLLHAAVDTATRFFLPNVEGLTRTQGNLAIAIAFGAWALLLVAVTRGRLGYAPENDSADRRPARA